MNKKNGFTLIELMAVIVIMGVLAAVGIPKLFGVTAKAKAAEVPTAAGTYVHLQEAHLHSNHVVGTWQDIGYKAPGNGQTNNFLYSDCIQQATTIQSGAESFMGWQASNIYKLNDCSVRSSWGVFLDPIGEQEAKYRQVTSSAECAALTSNWAVENIDASACNAASNGN